MKLLTVTCWRDRELIKLQLQSIRKFLKPCYHIVILLEPNSRKRQILKQDILKFSGKGYFIRIVNGFWKPQWGPSKFDGWGQQQIHKLLAYKYLEDDYLILDSKNFFIKDDDINNWKNIIGSGHLSDNIDFVDINRAYAKFFNCGPLPTQLASNTPFVIDHRVLQSLGKPNKLARMLCDIEPELPKKPYPSEFIFYSYLVRDKLTSMIELKRYETVWPESAEWFDDILQNAILDPNVKIFGVHHGVISRLTEEQKNNFITTLDSLGITLDKNYLTS